MFCLSVLQKMWVQRFIQQKRLLYIQYTYIACKYKIISMSYRNQRASNELFSCFKVLVQSNFIFADILYCAYTTMLCVQKIVQFRHKKEKHWTFLLNFLLGIYSRFSVQPVFISTRSWVLGDSIHLYVHL